MRDERTYKIIGAAMEVDHELACGFLERSSIGMILEICGSKVTIVTDNNRVRPEKSEVMELICDNSLARELLGREPKYSPPEGLVEIVAWMRDNLDRYKTDIYNV